MAATRNSSQRANDQMEHRELWESGLEFMSDVFSIEHGFITWEMAARRVPLLDVREHSGI